MQRLIVLGLCVFVARCSSTTKHEAGRVFVDSSTHEDRPPQFVSSTKTTWEENGKVFFKSLHVVSGNERVNGCFDLAKLDSSETLLTEIANDVRGSIENAQQSISEQAEAVLGKVRSSEWSGRLTGLRHTENYFERYRIGDQERINCYVLSEMKLDDYAATKRRVVEKIAAVDPRLKEAINKKQIDFFERKPSSNTSDSQ